MKIITIEISDRQFKRIANGDNTYDESKSLLTKVFKEVDKQNKG